MAQTPYRARPGNWRYGVVSDLASGLKASEMSSVMIGTTQFTNAFVEGKKLVKVATIRVSLLSTESLRPMADFPAHLRAAVGEQSYLVKGAMSSTVGSMMIWMKPKLSLPPRI